MACVYILDNKRLKKFTPKCRVSWFKIRNLITFLRPLLIETRT